MKVVTSITILTTEEGKRLSITFSEIDSDGKIIKDNERVNRVVVDPDTLAEIANLWNFAQGIVERM